MKYKLTEILGEENRFFLEFIKYAVYGIFAYLNIKGDLVFILSILMLCDMFFGIVKALRLSVKVKISIMMWGFVTKLSLLMIPMVVALMGKAIGKDFIWAVDFAIKMLVVNEGFSILANILSIKNKKDIENFDFVSLTINTLRDFVVNKFKNYVNEK
mgnify:CR=1 FL=1